MGAAAGIPIVGAMIGGIGSAQQGANARDAQLDAYNRAISQNQQLMTNMSRQWSPWQQAGLAGLRNFQNLATDPEFWGSMGQTPGYSPAQGVNYSLPTWGGAGQAGQPQPTQGGFFSRVAGLIKNQQQPNQITPEPSNPGYNAMMRGGQGPEGSDYAGPMRMPTGETGGPNWIAPVDPGGMGMPPDVSGRGGPGGRLIDQTLGGLPPGVESFTNLAGGSGGPGGRLQDQAGGPPSWLGSWLGMGQQPGGQGQGSWSFGAQTPSVGNVAMQDVLSDPGYNFGLQQGIAGANQGLAARGAGLSGAGIKAATQYATDYATTKYNDAFNRALAARGQNLQDQGQNFQQGLAGAQFGLGAQSQLFGQDLANRQFGWSQLANTRDFNAMTRQQQLAALSQLASWGMGATQNLGNVAGATTGAISNSLIGQGNAQAQDFMNKGQQWQNFGQTMSGVGGFMMGNQSPVGNFSFNPFAPMTGYNPYNPYGRPG